MDALHGRETGGQAPGWTVRNNYDVRLPCVGVPRQGLYCYDWRNLQSFLRRADVRSALGVATAGGQEWHICHPEVKQRWRHAPQWARGYYSLLKSVLEQGVRVLNYVGDADAMCGWPGNRLAMLQLQWSGQQAFAEAPEEPWRLPAAGGNRAGMVRATPDRLLTLLRVHNSGHMVP